MAHTRTVGNSSSTTCTLAWGWLTASHFIELLPFHFIFSLPLVHTFTHTHMCRTKRSETIRPHRPTPTLLRMQCFLSWKRVSCADHCTMHARHPTRRRQRSRRLQHARSSSLQGERPAIDLLTSPHQNHPLSSSPLLTHSFPQLTSREQRARCFSPCLSLATIDMTQVILRSKLRTRVNSVGRLGAGVKCHTLHPNATLPWYCPHTPSHSSISRCACSQLLAPFIRMSLLRVPCTLSAATGTTTKSKTTTAGAAAKKDDADKPKKVWCCAVHTRPRCPSTGCTRVNAVGVGSRAARVRVNAVG